MVEIDWQDVVALALAAACAIWLAWSTVRPFVRRVASACGMCGGCAPSSGVAASGQAAPDAAATTELLQIVPAGGDSARNS